MASSASSAAAPLESTSPVSSPRSKRNHSTAGSCSSKARATIHRSKAPGSMRHILKDWDTRFGSCNIATITGRFDEDLPDREPTSSETVLEALRHLLLGNRSAGEQITNNDRRTVNMLTLALVGCGGM